MKIDVSAQDGGCNRRPRFWRMFAVAFASIMLSDFVNSWLRRIWGQSRWRDVGVTFLCVFVAMTGDMLWAGRRSKGDPS